MFQRNGDFPTEMAQSKVREFSHEKWRVVPSGYVERSYWSHGPVEILEISLLRLVIFHGYVSLLEGKSHKIPLNHHFPMVFLWFSQ